jgi:putative acetyltransferase
VALDFRVEELSTPDVRALIDDHVAAMRSQSPPGSTHALPADGLSDPAITSWAARRSSNSLVAGRSTRVRGYERLWLETGSSSHFVAARGMYESAGFEYCEPFGEYVEDPESVFMTLSL